MEQLRTSVQEHTPPAREALKHRLPAFLSRVSPQVGAWLIPLAVQMGCAIPKGTPGADLDAQRQAFIAQRTDQFARNEIMPSHTHTTADGRVWTSGEMLRHLQQTTGTTHVQDLLNIEYSDAIYGPALTPPPPELDLPSSADPPTNRRTNEIHPPAPDSLRLAQVLQAGYPSSWTSHGQMPDLAYIPRRAVFGRPDYQLPTGAESAGECYGGTGLSRASVRLYESALYPDHAFRPGDLQRTMNHELGHTRDAWRTETAAAIRLEMAFYSVYRIESNEGIPPYAQDIQGPTPEELFHNKSTELFALDTENLLSAEERVIIQGDAFTLQRVQEALSAELQISLTTARYIEQNMSRFLRLGSLHEREARARARVGFVEHVFNDQAQAVVRDQLFAQVPNEALREVLLQEFEPSLAGVGDAHILQHGAFLRQGELHDIALVELTPVEAAALDRYRINVEQLILKFVEEDWELHHSRSIAQTWINVLGSFGSIATALSGDRTPRQARFALERFGDRHAQWNELVRSVREDPQLLTPQTVSILRRATRVISSLERVAAREDLPILQGIAIRARATHHYVHSPL